MREGVEPGPEAAGAQLRRTQERGGGALHIDGGTFTDRNSIGDLAHKVSEEIMHSVRMQGGLLPQM